MKKIVSLFICAVILVSCLSLTAFAKETDLMFSIKGAEGKPGDQVDVEVYVDKNVGTWAAKFFVNFDGKALKLIDVKNGEVFKDREFVKSLLTNDGFYIYYAQMDDPTENNANTGLILTLTFEITERAVNGYHDIWLTFPDNGVGWFFDAKNLDNDRTVPADKEVKASITVSGSAATSEPATDDRGVIPDKETKAPVTAYVTDAQNEIVTNDKGDAETYVVETAKQEEIPVYVTDTDGNFVRDSEGNYETYYADKNGNIIDAPESKADTTSAPEEKVPSESARKIILIAAIAAVIVAAIIIIAVVTGGKKADKSAPAVPVAPESDGSNAKTDDSDGDNKNTED